MNLEEAKANIGKEVVLDESTKPYRCDAGLYLEKHNYFYEGNDLFISEVDKDTVSVSIKNKNHRQIGTASFYAKHLKLKEQPMQNYKIKVTPETSEEVQKLFFELGCKWSDSGKIVSNLNSKHIYSNGGERIVYGDSNEIFNESKNQEITLPQLRDLVVLKRGSKEMTWQDALRAVADGKEVEFYQECYQEWHNIGLLAVDEVVNDGCKFRLKPKTTQLNGDYTKEELLKIISDLD